MRSHLPNIITLSRIMLVPVFAAFIYYMDTDRSWFHDAALAVFILCAVSDALDGILARTLKAQSVYGTVLDPIADKLLLLTGFVGLAAKGILPMWLVIIIVARDILIITGVIVVDLITGVVSIKPSPLGKITTFFQMILIIFALCHFPWTNPWVYATAIITIVSGIDYAISGSRILHKHPGQNR